ncbi:MAG: hypothetical protein ACP5G4_00140 [bacterium]
MRRKSIPNRDALSIPPVVERSRDDTARQRGFDNTVAEPAYSPTRSKPFLS